MADEPVAEHLADSLRPSRNIGLLTAILFDGVDEIARQTEVHRLCVDSRSAFFWFVGSIY